MKLIIIYKNKIVQLQINKNFMNNKFNNQNKTIKI